MSHAPMTLRFSALGLRGSATANQTFTPCTYQFNNLFRFLPASCGLLTRRAYTFGSPKSVTDQGRRRWTSNRLVQAEAASRYLGPTSWSRSNSTSPSDFGELTQEAWKTHPDRFKPLTMQEISRIFGPGLSLQLGNDLLRMIQMHRITGTLDHEIELDGIDEGHIAKGLSWLRSIYPLDEDTAIMKRIEAEEKLMEEEFRKTAKDGLNYTPQASAENGGVYGKSRFDEIMEATKAKAEAQATEEKAEKDNPSVETSKIERPADRAVLKRRKESAQWVQAYKEKARLSKLEEPPEMSKTARLFPATIFTIVCVGLCLLFAQNYQPPVRHARLFPDLPPAAATVLAIISVNVVILACWKIPPFWRVMNTYFLLIPATPNHLSVLGNAFSHHGIGHFFSNMAFLWFVGTRCSYTSSSPSIYAC